MIDEKIIENSLFTEIERKVLFLIHIEGKTQTETSKILGKSPPWIRQKLISGNEKIRRLNTIQDENTLIEYCLLSARSRNILHLHQIKTVKDIQNFTIQQLLQFRSLGKVCIKEIQKYLRKYGLCLIKNVYKVNKEWEYFKIKHPICLWIWVSDFKNVWLYERISTSEINENFVWRRANIKKPEIPKIDLHKNKY